MSIYSGKPYDFFLLCGRLSTIHKGHQSLIETGFKFCDRGLLLLGSAQEVGTERNPYDITTRIDMVRAIYNDSLIIKPLNDLTTENDITPEWGKYVLDNVKKYMGTVPPVMIYGNDESRSKWFDPEDIQDTLEIIVPRSKIKVSGTECRKLLQEGRREEWCEMVDPKIHKYYERLRNELLSVPFYLKENSEQYWG